MTYITLDHLPVKSPFPGFRGNSSDRSRCPSSTGIYPPAQLPAHSHVHEQVAHTFEGYFEITVDGQTQILDPGSVFVIAPNAVHSGKALTDCRILDVFSPVREDYIPFEQEDATGNAK